MSNQDDRFDEVLRNAARDYNNPPELSGAQLERMWSAVEGEAFPRRFASPSAQRQTPIAQRWLTARQVLPLAAVLVLGIAIGRYSTKPSSGPQRQVVTKPASDTV